MLKLSWYQLVMPLALFCLVAVCFAFEEWLPAEVSQPLTMDMPSTGATEARVHAPPLGVFGEEFAEFVRELPPHYGLFVLPRGLLVVANAPRNANALLLARWFAARYYAQQHGQPMGLLGAISPYPNTFTLAASAAAYQGGLEGMLNAESDLTIISSGPVVGRIGNQLVVRKLVRRANHLELIVGIQRSAVIALNTSPYCPLVEVPLGRLPPGHYRLHVIWRLEPQDWMVRPEPDVFQAVEFRVLSSR